ncbi:DGQHR domain-containing protein [Dyella japonica]|uniref:DGQHR domain-containing protein n=1 Tax=Dyella japonica TaxID=231455 RepID=A0ABV2JWA7_9GAMM
MKYEAFVFKQRGNASPSLALFYAPATEILEWAAIDRLAPKEKGGVQRIENKARTKHLAEFFRRHEQNVIPTSVIVSLEGVVVSEENGKTVINFDVANDAAKKPGLVIDGQHRLLGMSQLDEPVLVPVVALLNVDDGEKAFQFIVINNKGQKVPTDHIRALRLDFKEDSLNERLKSARLSVKDTYTSVGVANDSPESPFRGIVDWAKTPKEDRRVSAAAIEQSVHLLMNAGDRLLADQDAAEDFFFSLWRLTKEVWPRAWEVDSPYDDDVETHLLNKSSIIALTDLIKDYLVKWASFPKASILLDEPETYQEHMKELLDLIAEDFWLVAWRLASLDTAAGRRAITEGLEQVIQNRRAELPWNDKVSLIDTTWLKRVKYRTLQED